jgi:hypothetical protein
MQETTAPQRFFVKFPAEINRESISNNREGNGRIREFLPPASRGMQSIGAPRRHSG